MQRLLFLLAVLMPLKRAEFEKRRLEIEKRKAEIWEEEMAAEEARKSKRSAQGTSERSIAEATNQGNFTTSAKASVQAARPKKKPGKAHPAMSSGEKEPPCMRGRLHKHLSFWKTFCQSTLVMAWISSGFPLKWTNMAPQPPRHFGTTPLPLKMQPSLFKARRLDPG